VIGVAVFQNWVDFVEGETGSSGETCVTCDVDRTEEVFVKVEDPLYVENETPEAKSFPPVTTEHEGPPNEQLDVHGAESRYSCNIGSSKRTYICTVCNKPWSRKSDFRRHQRTHSDESPYFCDVCNKPFRHKGSLITHQRIHSGERPYICNVCNKEFINQSALARHRRIHTELRGFCGRWCWFRY